MKPALLNCTTISVIELVQKPTSNGFSVSSVLRVCHDHHSRLVEAAHWPDDKWVTIETCGENLSVYRCIQWSLENSTKYTLMTILPDVSPVEQIVARSESECNGGPSAESVLKTVAPDRDPREFLVEMLAVGLPTYKF